MEYVNIHDFDASMIAPEWHSWMHYTFDEPPSKETLASLPHIRSVIKSDVNFRSHVGGVRIQTEIMTNKSLWRSHGWGTGSIYTKAGEPDGYYLNPGHPLHPQSERHRFKAQSVAGISYEDAEAEAVTNNTELVKVPQIRRLSEW